MRPIDSDALIKTLEPHGLKNSAALGWHSGIIDAVIDEIRKMPTIGGWISVKDRLPEQVGCRCLVSAEYGDGKRTVFTAFTGYGEPRWWTYDITHMERAMYADNHVHHNYHITHWMPLPEPPKDGEVE